MSKNKKSSLRRKTIFLCFFAIAAILAWFVIRIITVDTEIKIIKTYELPKSSSLMDLYNLESGDYAAAIDGEIVSSKDSERKILPTASTAKMILSLAIIKKEPFDLDESGKIIKISDEDYNKYVWYANNGGSYTTVQIGEEISEYDALASVLLASSNNMADTLACWAFGDMDNYRKYATEMLTEWGINNTTIGNDASGFSDSTTSTAADLARIGFKLLKSPVLAKIVNTKSATVPVAGTINNTNKLLGINNIIGIKTGYIGDVSGYCLVTGYQEGDHIITVALLGATTRENSFTDSLKIIQKLQETAKIKELIKFGQKVGYYESWWTGKVDIVADGDLGELTWEEAKTNTDLMMNGDVGLLNVVISGNTYSVNVKSTQHIEEPTLIEKIKHIFGWHKENDTLVEETSTSENEEKIEDRDKPSDQITEQIEISPEEQTQPGEEFTNAKSTNCTVKLGALMLINPNFTVEESFINERRRELVSISSRYGIIEGNSGNGDNLLDAEAAAHINDMVNAYKAEYPGHTLETRSCFRARGTSCGRLCAATGASDHHTGLTCDLLDPAYGTSLDTDTLNQHIDWQWLKANSYKYGFIDRFPEAWAGGSMDEPLNVDENGSTGLYETWHYRYVGIEAAKEIATGKYNNGQYDSLEHYLKAKGLVKDLKRGLCN